MPSNNLNDYLDPEPGAEYQPCGQPAEVDNGYGHGAYPFCAGHRSSDKVEKALQEIYAVLGDHLSDEGHECKDCRGDLRKVLEGYLSATGVSEAGKF